MQDHLIGQPERGEPLQQLPRGRVARRRAGAAGTCSSHLPTSARSRGAVGQRRGELDDEHAGRRVADRPAPHGGSVGDQPDLAQEIGGGRGGGHDRSGPPGAWGWCRTARAGSRRRACGTQRIVSPTCPTSPPRQMAGPEPRRTRRDAGPSRCGDRARHRGPRRGDRPARRLRPRAVGHRRRGDLGAHASSGPASPVRGDARRSDATRRDRHRPAHRQPHPRAHGDAATAEAHAGADGTARAEAARRGRHDRVGPRARAPAAARRLAGQAPRPRRVGRDAVGRRTDVAGRLGERRRRGRPARHARHRLRPRLDLQDLHGGRRPAARRRGQAPARRAGGAAPARVRHRSPGHGPDAARPHQRHQRLLLQPEDRPRAAVEPGRHVDRQAHVALRAGRAASGRARSGATPTRTTCCWASS